MANPRVVAEVLRQFESGAPGLNEPRFVAVRDALRAWHAELARPSRDDLPAAAIAAKENFRGVPKAQADAAGASLRQALDRLLRFVGPGANGQAWRRYLMLDVLEAQLAEGATPDFAALDAVLEKFASQRPGLELPQFTAVRRALDEYCQAGRVALDPMVREEYVQKLDVLAKALEDYAKQPNAAAAYQIGNCLDWLEVRGEAPDLVAAVQYYYAAQPNFIAEMSEPLVAAGLVRNVDQVRPVTDLILGTRISGTGHTTGRVAVDLVPSDKWGIVDMLLNGHTASRTVGLNGPARINSAGSTSFQARKRVFVNQNGIVSPPATAAARTNTRTLGVNAGGRIATRIASGRVASSKPQAEAISADHAEDRITRDFDREANPQIRDANKKYQEQIRQPLMDRGQFPKVLNFRTSDRALHCVAVQATGGQLSAPGPAPEIETGRSLAVRIHESALNNLAAGLLSGEKLTKKEFQQDVKDFFGKLPEEWEQEEGTWEITFEPEQPITIAFFENGIRVTMRVRRLEGVVDSRTPWRITADYKLERNGIGFKAIRQGEQIEVEPLNEDAGGRAVAEKANVRRQMERILFKKEYEQQGLELPGDWAKVGKLPLAHLVSENGWLALAWTMP